MTAAISRLRNTVGSEMAGPLVAFIIVMIVFGIVAPHFSRPRRSVRWHFQLPELGLLTLAMLLPILTGGLNLAITFTANIAGLTLAWVLQANGGVDAGIGAFILGSILAILVGALSGLIMGLVIAYTKAHPILVSLSMMIFLRGLGSS